MFVAGYATKMETKSGVIAGVSGCYTNGYILAARGIFFVDARRPDMCCVLTSKTISRATSSFDFTGFFVLVDQTSDLGS